MYACRSSIWHRSCNNDCRYEWKPALLNIPLFAVHLVIVLECNPYTIMYSAGHAAGLDCYGCKCMVSYQSHPRYYPIIHTSDSVGVDRIVQGLLEW